MKGAGSGRSNGTVNQIWSVHLLVAAMALFVLWGCKSAEEKFADHMGKGEQYMTDQKYPEAVIEYRNAVQLQPNSAEAHHGLGLAYLQSNDLNKTFWEMKEAVRLDPELMDAQLQLGKIFLLSQDFKSALEKAKLVLENDPDHLEGHLLLGGAYAGEKQFDHVRAPGSRPR